MKVHDYQQNQINKCDDIYEVESFLEATLFDFDKVYEFHYQGSEYECMVTSTTDPHKNFTRLKYLQKKEKPAFKVGDEVLVNYNKPLVGNSVAPPLELDETYIVQDIIYDKDLNQHLDVGLKSMYNTITSYDTGEELYLGDKIHWCHPSRFIKINKK